MIPTIPIAKTWNSPSQEASLLPVHLREYHSESEEGASLIEIDSQTVVECAPLFSAFLCVVSLLLLRP